MNKVIYLVTGNHVHPDYRLEGEKIEVFTDYDRHNDVTSYYARHKKLGCGKNYGTPLKAIYGLCQSHAISVTSSVLVSESDSGSVSDLGSR